MLQAITKTGARVSGLLFWQALVGCSWLGTPAAPESPPAPAAPVVEMLSGGLLASETGKPELGLTLANRSDRTLWLQVRFRTPAGLRDCLLTREVAAQAKSSYFCRQSRIQTDADYVVEIEAFSDIAQTRSVIRLTTRFRFDQDDVGGAGAP